MHACQKKSTLSLRTCPASSPMLSFRPHVTLSTPLPHAAWPGKEERKPTHLPRVKRWKSPSPKTTRGMAFGIDFVGQVVMPTRYTAEPRNGKILGLRELCEESTVSRKLRLCLPRCRPATEPLWPLCRASNRTTTLQGIEMSR